MFAAFPAPPCTRRASRRWRRTVALTCLAVLTAATTARAQLFDPNFSATTNNVGVHAAAVQGDGKVVIGGYFTQVNATPRNYFARLMPDGALDTAFTPTANSYVWSIALQPDGKILVGGQFSTFGGAPGRAIVRLNSDGSRDGTFVPPASFQGNVRAIVVQPDGRILLGGYVYNGSQYATLVRLNADGSLDGAFSPQPNDYVYDIARQPDGRILIAGAFTTVAGASRNHFARLQPNGALDNSFDPNAQGGVGYAVALRPDGKVLLGGSFNWVGGDTRNNLALVGADGARDVSFNPSPNQDVYDIVVQADGRAVIGGQFTAIGPANVRTLARINAEGSLDTTFVPFTAIGGYVQNVLLQADGKIIATGDYGPNTVARFLAGGAANAPPTIVPPAAQTLLATQNGYTTGQLPFTVGDADDPIESVVVTVVGSSNPNIVNPSSIFFQGTGASRTLRLATGGGNVVGTTTITLRANDGLNTTDASFTVTTTSVNLAPVVTPIANQSVSGTPTQSLSTGALPFTVTDPEGFPVTVTAVSTNTTLVPNFNISVGGSGANRTVNVFGAFGESGQTMITLTASDGVMSTAISFVVTFSREVTDRPRNLQVARSGNTVQFTWQAPLQGAVAGYLLDVGFSVGGTVLSLPVGNTLTFGAIAPSGRYYVRVRAQMAGGSTTGPSNEVTFSTDEAPLAPQNLQALVSGNNVTLGWTANPLGSPPLAFQLLVGTGPGLTNIGVLPLPPTSRSLAVAAPTGIYYLRLRAVNAFGASGESNEIRITPGICETPAAPTGLSAAVVPGGVSLAWNAPAGAPPTGYILVAGSVPGGSDVGIFPLPPTLAISSPAPSMRYYVRVHATTGPGCRSAASSEITFVVP